MIEILIHRRIPLHELTSLLGPPAGGCIRKASTHPVWEPLKPYSGLGFYDGLRAGLVTSVDALLVEPVLLRVIIERGGRSALR